MIVTGSVSFNGSSNASIATSITNGVIGSNQLASNAVTTNKITNSNVTFAKIQNINTARMLGRNSTGSGSVEELDRDAARSFLGITDEGLTTYTHPTDGVDFGDATTGAEIISDVTVNNEGHVTGFSRRTLTYSDLSSIVQRKTHIGTDAPPNPVSGDMWLDTDDITLYVYMADGDSSQWVRIGS